GEFYDVCSSTTGSDALDSPQADSALHQALTRFQRYHGLEPDGLLGPDTRQALNVSADERAQQLLCVARQVRENSDSSSVLIAANIAAFRLSLIEQNQTTLSARMIVGTAEKQTPTFSTELRSLIIAPNWYIPYSIASEEILDDLQQDARYASRQRMNVYQNWRPVDADTVDWSNYSTDDFPFQIRQEPGPWNQLGRVKFVIPNSMQIGLHGTPDVRLFNTTCRAYSHGCLRLQDPEVLVKALVRQDSIWTAERIEDAVQNFITSTITLAAPVPFHVVYWTAWIDEDAIVRFSPDIYDRDPCSSE
ncbi:MAG: L,D-transpeptidase family protein, partial [Rhodothermales bacterium]|nr:L,D-transpeptidase family protein [Rhodothermales bacterium]